MSRIIEEQLKKCVYADLSHYDEETGIYRIPKYTKPQFLPGKCYIVRLPREILGDRTSVLATNWNNGSAPNMECCKAYVNKAMGKYIYADCLAYDWESGKELQDIWSGWLDLTTLTQLAAL